MHGIFSLEIEILNDCTLRIHYSQASLCAGQAKYKIFILCKAMYPGVKFIFLSD